MIIMINGAFGSGKTSAAYMLQPLLENSIVFDPEEVGYMLRKVVPEYIRSKEECTDDFQDMELWRILTLHTIIEIKKKYNKNLIIPVTIYKVDNFEYIMNGLRKIDPHVYHFCLIASEENIYQRLRKRGDTSNGWTYQQTRKCIQALKDQRFGVFIHTDEISTDDVVDQMMSQLSIVQA